MKTTQQFFSAIQAGDVDGLKALLEVDPALVNARTQKGVSGVLIGTYYGQPEIVKILLAHNPQLDIFDAAATGQLEPIEALLDEQPDLVNVFAPDGFTPLGLAAFFNHLPIVELLLARGANVNLASQNAQRVMPLHSSVALQSLAITKTLLAHGADVNAVQEENYTPLHEAARNGQLDMVKLLLDYGATVRVLTSAGKSALVIAQEGNHSDVVALLEQHQ